MIQLYFYDVPVNNLGIMTWELGCIWYGEHFGQIGLEVVIWQDLYDAQVMALMPAMCQFAVSGIQMRRNQIYSLPQIL